MLHSETPKGSKTAGLLWIVAIIAITLLALWIELYVGYWMIGIPFAIATICVASWGIKEIWHNAREN